ncbi:MAG: TetR/AcrR family transcriptional regulator, partial [Hyphomonadaceae bacterium]|nr:TetR/AcrR family transcriptional regulator [Hyphomonadaceae bacterium]
MATANRPYHRQNLEEDLLAKAAEIVASGGVEALSLRELGRAAGVSRSAAYHYFADKTVLLARVGERGFERLAKRLQRAGAKHRNPRKRAHAGFRAYFEFAREEEPFFRLMFANVLRRDVATSPDGAAAGYAFSSAAAQQAFSLMVQAVLEATKSTMPQALLHANVVWAFVHGLAVLAIDDNVKFA